MRTKDIIRIARDRAGLTQEMLAARSERPRETIVRWENGSQIPSLEAVSALVSACDLELVLRIANQDTSLSALVSDQLQLSPVERLMRLLPRGAGEETMTSLLWLARARTKTLVIGQVGAALLGGPQVPEDPRVEFVAHDHGAIERELASAGYHAVDAPERWRDSDRREPWAGPAGDTLAIARFVPGTADWRDLRHSKTRVQLNEQTGIEVAHPRDLLRIAEASPREAERSRVPGLQTLLQATSS